MIRCPAFHEGKCALLAFAIAFASATLGGCGGSTSQPGGNGNPAGGTGNSAGAGNTSGGAGTGGAAASGLLTCMNPPDNGPLSVACASCGAIYCPVQQESVFSSCASLASCIQACPCETGNCEAACITSASSSCQTLITSFGDCTKMNDACTAACSQP